MHPLSRGIAFADPGVQPAIDPNYFANPADTSPLKDVVRKQVAPTPEQSATDEALFEYIKENCNTVYHPLGAAAMLPREMIDPELKVYGTQSVDASVIPFELSAHIQGTVYAITEKARTGLLCSPVCIVVNNIC
ncbi:GMC oxidoreductase-domain-containing protein [Trametes elegans]|nr:GMC oxidoreductase-domain-containing protein [Trametes elegans]